MAAQIQIAMDAADPVAQAGFWQQMLGYTEPPPPPGADTWQDWLRDQEVPEAKWGDVRVLIDPDGKGPRLFIQKVPEPKTAKNRVHMDLHISESLGGLEQAVAKAESLGAKRIWEKEEFGVRWVTLADPEGNEFCIS